jgi:hypothetical protein
MGKGMLFEINEVIMDEHFTLAHGIRAALGRSGVYISMTKIIRLAHKHNTVGGIFMGWFYGYAAIGTYASLKTNILKCL